MGHLLRLWPWVTIGFRWKKAERWRAGIFPIPMSEASDPLGIGNDLRVDLAATLAFAPATEIALIHFNITGER